MQLINPKRASQKWIPNDLKKDRVRDYLRRVYGAKAFKKDGTINLEFIRKALKKAKDASLKRALRLAITFKSINK